MKRRDFLATLLGAAGVAVLAKAAVAEVEASPNFNWVAKANPDSPPRGYLIPYRAASVFPNATDVFVESIHPGCLDIYSSDLKTYIRTIERNPKDRYFRIVKRGLK